MDRIFVAQLPPKRMGIVVNKEAWVAKRLIDVTMVHRFPSLDAAR
jgi:hypothetical protein